MHTGVYRVNGARCCPLIVASPVRWWKKLDFVANDNHYRFCGSSWWGGPEHGAGGRGKRRIFVILSSSSS
ncbi:hypothetical protein BFL18_15640 [Escherichia coli]|nr:hypothetical protein BFL18_15640 [Escherichia coli]